ncbi:alkyl/aryl-sulfatase [Photobacterium lutimaris]|uniref:MBL fold metallo-hydrolase n=1 Tax=Photobacterium lutimaris TaxID=388278 RepID=A0A2T3J4C8_9GAMM|nr:alkyl sulfatase dimerization domain-containing protein [Photobacterium lutimaris]PSU36158.1 MBL fold metallo-hydrolase [Photobacterium lutimaris]TDR74975.1 alkyl sulfatase BDS1-like metallo-beta-lactamase superfamily hydrolase [Photobacterium lutimaris]
MKLHPLFIACGGLLCAQSVAAAQQHPHEHINSEALRSVRGNLATEHTIKANQDFAKGLNFNDVEVFRNNDRGLIVELDETTSTPLRYRFSGLHQGESVAHLSPDSVNPSLWRQAQANFSANGLYKVKDDIYQVRGVDLSSATFIRSKSGWIVYDVLMQDKPMVLALDFFLSNVPDGGDLPIVAMIYSHSHADHFGGSRAVLERFPDVKVYAPHNFIKETIDENVLAGNAMSRRAGYQYGATLGASAQGVVDAALANGYSVGEGYQVTMVPPHETLPSGESEKFHERVIDGVQFVFMDTAGTEAPSGNVAYLPAHNTLWTGEMVYQGMHNIYTLRGAKVRDALKWSKDINEMIHAWGGEVAYLMGSHSAPIWGNENIVEYLKLQRDNYGFVHNQTLRLANNGMGIQDIGATINDELPASLREVWHTNGYHGTYSHNARAVYNMYLGYFDMNPANLNPLPVQEESELFTEAFGGCKKATEFAKAKFDEGHYRFVSSMMDKVVRTCPEDKAARRLLANSFEQQGYQAEGAGWRNVFLTGAQELRVGTMSGTAKSASPDLISQMTVSNLLDYLAVRVVAKEAEGKDFTIAIHLPDIEENHLLELSHGNLSNIMVNNKPEAGTQLTIKKGDIVAVQLGEVTFDELLSSGKATLSGDKSALKTLTDIMVNFDDSFEIVPRPGVGQTVDAHFYKPLK